MTPAVLESLYTRTNCLYISPLDLPPLYLTLMLPSRWGVISFQFIDFEPVQSLPERKGCFPSRVGELTRHATEPSGGDRCRNPGRSPYHMPEFFLLCPRARTKSCAMASGSPYQPAPKRQVRRCFVSSHTLSSTGRLRHLLMSTDAGALVSTLTAQTGLLCSAAGRFT